MKRISTAPRWGGPTITRGRTAIALVIAAACGSSQPATTTASSASTLDPAAREQAEREQREREEREEREHKAQVTAEHRKLESEQQDALAATCDLVKRAAKPDRCLPSCYAFEPADPRAGTKLTGAVAIDHLVCQRPGADDAYLIADELDAKLTARAVRGRFPKPHKQGSWQEALATAMLTALSPPPPAPAKKGRGKSAAARPAANADVVIVAGAWRAMAHPVTKEKLRCVTVAHYTKALRKPLDACAGDGSLGCEANGDAAAHGINVVRYRLSEARRLQAAGKREDCQQAALEAVAVARGMPRWRQYAKLNVDQWADRIAYKTRFDGLLDEDTLFATATTLGQEAESVFTSCGGAPGAPTTVAQEQSFHTCP